jgi:hypothetical protein
LLRVDMSFDRRSIVVRSPCDSTSLSTAALSAAALSAFARISLSSPQVVATLFCS